MKYVRYRKTTLEGCHMCVELITQRGIVEAGKG